ERCHAEAIRAAHARGEVAPASVQYAELAGLSVTEADESELAGLAKVFHGGKLAAGTATSLIGNLVGASGAASLLRVLLSLRHRTRLPTAGHVRPGPAVPWTELPLRCPDKPAPWPENADGSPRRAGVTSIDPWGSVWHLVVDEFQEKYEAGRKP